MISVIMLTYNRESMVGRAIESILNQTYRDFEYIIVDNGSDDRSGEIADAYAAKDPRIKVLHIEKSNIGTGRNIGLDAATGEYITFIDDDDTAEPDMLEFLYGLAKEQDADISLSGSMKEVNGEFLPKTTHCIVHSLLYPAVFQISTPFFHEMPQNTHLTVPGSEADHLW